MSKTLYGIPCEDDEQTEENIVNTTIKTYDKKAEKDMLEFEKNYKSAEALKFYTNDSFLYRLFNQAFRTENIDLLFIFRFFLRGNRWNCQIAFSMRYSGSKVINYADSEYHYDICP
jgi:hypothetical protein